MAPGGQRPADGKAQDGNEDIGPGFPPVPLPADQRRQQGNGDDKDEELDHHAWAEGPLLIAHRSLRVVLWVGWGRGEQAALTAPACGAVRSHCACLPPLARAQHLEILPCI
jgi:hypothetical protein